MKRRIFIKNTGQFGLALSVLGLASCNNDKKKKTSKESFFKLSLAQWSVHRMIQNKELNPMDFAKKASEWGFSGLEYVNHLYNQELAKNTNLALSVNNLTSELNKRCNDYDIKNLVMMVDLQGNDGALASPDKAVRDKAIENHHVWADATSALNCHSMRVNLFGTIDRDEWKAAAIESLGKLSEYAAKNNVNVIVENHGWLSSDALLLTDVIKEVGMDNCGTLPDFGNFCLKREDGAQWGTKCIEEYDKYKGVKELMPFAKAVSAKSYGFDENGNETTIDYGKMLRIVKDAGYNGHIGVEWEGDGLSEENGIKATRDLLIRIGSELA